MYTGEDFSLFFLHVSEMGDVKALITHQMSEAKGKKKKKKKQSEAFQKIKIQNTEYLTSCWTESRDGRFL